MTTQNPLGPWQTDGVVRPRSVDGFDTQAIAIGASNSARAIALVYAGFGDGPEVARLIVAAPLLREAAELFWKAAIDAAHAFNDAGLSCPASIALAAEKARAALAQVSRS